MTPNEWLGLGLGLLLAVVLARIAWAGSRPAPNRHTRTRRLVCPVLGHVVDCMLEQDVRTGQWKGVLRCWAFARPEEVTCEHDCMRRLNLGFALEGERPGEKVRS